MPRRLFEPQLGLRASANGGLEPAAGSSFRVFTDFQAGVEVTDLKGSDGVSDLPKDINGAQFAMDSNGNVPYFRGPDTGTGASETTLLFIDTGVGLRYPVVAVDALKESISALGDVAAARAAAAAAQSSASSAQSTALQASSDAASAAAAAQSAQQQVQAYIASGGGGGGGGIDETTLTTILNDGQGIAARGIFDRIVGFRTRSLVGTAYTGAWNPRPNLPIVLTIGIAPRPTDMGALDPWLEPATTA
jgi:hypothetical protein